MVKIIPHYISYPSGEREVDVLENKIEFILSQPQDFWLLYVMSMNWDQNDDVVNAIIDRADADIAIIAVLFWYSGPSILFNKPEGHPETNAERILKNLRAGWYQDCKYWIPRSYLAGCVTGFLKVALGQDTLPFEVPHLLFGPFKGKKAVIDFPLDKESFDLLEQEWPLTGCGLDLAKARKESIWDNYADHKTLAVLPKIESDHAERFSGLDMFAYGESIYATRDIIEAAYSKPQHGKAARKRRGSRDIPQSPIKILNRLSPFRQAVLALAFLAGWIWLSVRAVNWISVLFG